MENVKLYCSDMCSRCDSVREYMKENNIEVKLMDATKDMKLQKEIYELGGKAEVPMLYVDDKAIYEVDNIIAWFEKNK